MKLFNILFLLNFVERITIPPAVCALLPPWKTSSPKTKEHITETSAPINAISQHALNRRHCGQSQQSAILKQKTRQMNSKILGAERKKLAKPKKSRK